MTAFSSEARLGRVAVGLIAMAVFSAVSYTLISYGVRLFFPYIFIVAPVASMVVLCFYLPVWIILVRSRLTGPVILFFATFILIGFIFFLWNIFSLNGAITVVQGVVAIVKNGEITRSGYATLLSDAFITAVIAGLGALLFWCVVFGGKRARKK